jgi:excisionase family DNA binding protein
MISRKHGNPSQIENPASRDVVQQMGFNRPQAARYLGISLTLLDELLRAGKLKARAGGKRRIVISRHACDDWLSGS